MKASLDKLEVWHSGHATWTDALDKRYVGQNDFKEFKANTEGAVNQIAGMTQRVAAMEQDFQATANKVMDKIHADILRLTLQAQSATTATASGAGDLSNFSATQSALHEAFNTVNANIAATNSEVSFIKDNFNTQVVAAFFAMYNGKCHCIHVDNVITEVEQMQVRYANINEGIEAKFKEMEARNGGKGPDPWQHGGAAQPQASPTAFGPTTSPAAGPPADPSGLKAKHGGRLFDDKVPANPEYKWKGDKEAGPRWKAKVRSYMISKHAPIKVLLDWAESKDYEIIDESMVKQLNAALMTDMDAEEIGVQIWGFLSQCVTDNAWEHFLGADELNGCDAWRRLVLIIEEGRPRLLEELREKVRQIGRAHV
jgi:hypothetical protein